MLEFVRDKFFCKNKGQAMIEFAYAMIIVLLMGYALMMIFSYMGVDYIGRRKAHQAAMTKPIDRNYTDRKDGLVSQFQGGYYKPALLNAVFGD